MVIISALKKIKVGWAVMGSDGVGDWLPTRRLGKASLVRWILNRDQREPEGCLFQEKRIFLFQEHHKPIDKMILTLEQLRK